QQHSEPINAAAPAARWGHAVFQRFQEVFVEHLRLVVAARALAGLILKARALIEWVIQLGEGVTQLQPARERLEALHGVVRAGLMLRQRREVAWVVVEEERRLDLRLRPANDDILQRINQPP